MGDVNIRSLAKQLNLSISTVSKALKDSYEISIETKKRVVSLAKALHYNPNPFARSLRLKKSKTIAVVVPDVADSFFSAAIKGIEEIAQAKGYHVLLYLTHEKYLKEKKILEELKNGRVDGIMMSVTSETIQTKHIEEFINNSEYNIPVVFFDRAIDDMNLAKITTNDFESCQVATQHLIDQGCKKISYLSISNELSINKKRIEGFKSALTTNHINFSNKQIVECTNNAEKNETIITHLLLTENRPDGIIAGVEKLIEPVYIVCKNQKINIPTALKIISFSNLPYAPILNPSLTTITQPAYQIGQTAAKVLFKGIEKKGYSCNNENIMLPSELIIRESTSN